MVVGHLRGFRSRIEHGYKSIAKRVGGFSRQSAIYSDLASARISLYCAGRSGLGGQYTWIRCIRRARFAVNSLVGFERSKRITLRSEKVSTDSLFLDSIDVPHLLHSFVNANIPCGGNSR